MTTQTLLVNEGFQLNEAEQFIALLSADSSKEAQIAASYYFRKKLSNCQEPPSEVVQKLITALVSCLNRPYQEMQLNAAWALTNLACGTREDTHAIVEAGGIPALYTKARSSSGEVRDQAIWALGNIAADCKSCRELVRQSRLLQLLVHLLKQEDYQALEKRKTLVWCTVNLLRGGMAELTPMKVMDLLEQLHYTATMPDVTEEALSDTVWSVAYLLDHGDVNEERITLALDTPHLVPTIIGLLHRQSGRVLTACLRIIGNIVTGTDGQATRILEFDLLEHLAQLIDSDNDQTVRETLWILSNVAAGTEEHIAMLFADRNTSTKLFRLCSDGNPKKRKEAHWVIVNSLMGASDETFYYLLSGGAGHVLERILSEDLDHALMERTLLTIQNSLRDRADRLRYMKVMFRHVGLVSRMHERIIAHREAGFTGRFNAGHQAIQEVAASILLEFFGVDATEPMPLDPQVASLAFEVKRRRMQ